MKCFAIHGKSYKYLACFAVFAELQVVTLDNLEIRTVFCPLEFSLFISSWESSLVSFEVSGNAKSWDARRVNLPL
jgi:hypothetical protein